MLHLNEEIPHPSCFIHRFVLGGFACNSYVLASNLSKEALVIDPASQGGVIEQFIQSKKLHLKYILISHGHLDHVFGAERLKKNFPSAQLAMHEADEYLRQNLAMQCRLFGMPAFTMPEADLNLAKQKSLKLGDLSIECVHSPGHSRGHVYFYLQEQKILFSGDLLFKDSVGRTDLEGGSYEILQQTLSAMKKNTPQDVTILPGHGSLTTMGEEMRKNPYLR